MRRRLPLGFSSPGFLPGSRNFITRRARRAGVVRAGCVWRDGRRRPFGVTRFICVARVSARRRSPAARVPAVPRRRACQEAAPRSASHPNAARQMSEVNKRGAGVGERPCRRGAGQASRGDGRRGAGGGARAAGRREPGGTEPSLWLEQPGKRWGGFVGACVRAGGGMGGREQGSRDFSASHSSKHDINNTDYFRLPFVKVWNTLAASAEAWPRAGWLLPPAFLSWGAQPGVAAGLCALRQAARLENTLIFPPANSARHFLGCLGLVVCLAALRGCILLPWCYLHSSGTQRLRPGWSPCCAGCCANIDEGTLLPKELPGFRLKWLRRDKASQSKKLRLFFWIIDGEGAWI